MVREKRAKGLKGVVLETAAKVRQAVTVSADDGNARTRNNRTPRPSGGEREREREYEREKTRRKRRLMYSVVERKAS